MLLEYGTTCEFNEPCQAQAEYAYLGARIVAYLCGPHTILVEENMRLWAPLEGHFKYKFDELFNFFTILRRSYGALYEEIELTRDAARVEFRETQKANTVIRNTIKKDAERAAKAAYRDARKDVKPGAPDEALVLGRGVQPPPRTDQPLIRRPSILSNPSDSSASGLLILGKLLGGEGND